MILLDTVVLYFILGIDKNPSFNRLKTIEKFFGSKVVISSYSVFEIMNRNGPLLARKILTGITIAAPNFGFIISPYSKQFVDKKMLFDFWTLSPEQLTQLYFSLGSVHVDTHAREFAFFIYGTAGFYMYLLSLVPDIIQPEVDPKGEGIRDDFISYFNDLINRLRIVLEDHFRIILDVLLKNNRFSKSYLRKVLQVYSEQILEWLVEGVWNVANEDLEANVFSYGKVVKYLSEWEIKVSGITKKTSTDIDPLKFKSKPNNINIYKILFQKLKKDQKQIQINYFLNHYISSICYIVDSESIIEKLYLRKQLLSAFFGEFMFDVNDIIDKLNLLAFSTYDEVTQYITFDTAQIEIMKLSQEQKMIESVKFIETLRN
ncbi:MAG: hypothetical protein WC509_00125 [Candidatus Izemoplasmatales bacterium]